MKALLKSTLLAVLTALVLLPATATAAPDFFQGFETDTSGWFDGTATIARVPSGYTNGGGYADNIASAAGGFHARIQNPQTGDCAPPFSQSTQCDGPYTYWGGASGNPTFPAGGFVTEADIYLDTAWAATHVDYRFDWDQAINKNTGAHLSDVVFNVGTQGAGFIVGASPNATRGSTFPSNPCPAPNTGLNTPCRVPVLITTSGWYTFRHYFHDDGTGLLVVDMTIDDAIGNTIASWSLYPASNTGWPISQTGGPRYGWFANEEINDLPVDNTSLQTFAQPIKQAVRDDLATYRATVTDKQDGQRLDDAISHLDKSLASYLWTDPSHLDPKHGRKVFDEEKKAVQKLVEIQKDANSTVPPATAQSFIDRIVAIDRQLAVTAINDAAGGKANELTKANDELAKGDADAANGKPTTAIDHYKAAWDHAEKA